MRADFVLWHRHARFGKALLSSTNFRLPNGAIRAPDTAWVALTPAQRQGFAPLYPDFVLELASVTDDIADLRANMRAR